ncbi:MULTISPECIES: HAMP domain-containing sensor histidine kinase [Clostridium]|uniref:sensor histidine kinase n=1 Tax=Clostridium TaxID=1485 RepID=UPI001896E3C5|nr:MULTISPECIES: HAMP domain-containing sensor histidine kinase [Clostridium]MDI9215404.1 HAMP domain-containing histidine kinase [Clostridium tertium]
MSKTLRGKLLIGTIVSVVTINTIFTIFISLFLDKSFKNDIIEEMNKIKLTSLNIIRQNEIIEEPIWKALSPINEITQGYVTISDDYGNINQSIGKVINNEEIIDIVKESNNIKSVIKFKHENNSYFVTYNYPLYINDSFSGNLIIQKDYTIKYNEMIKTIGIIIFGQVVAILTIIYVISFIIKKVTKPLGDLTTSMKEFKLGKDIKDIEINTQDEIADLTRTYNSMKNQINNQEKALIEFFNNATHELKTPVTAISLYSQIIRDEDIKEIDEEFLKRASNRIVLECEKMKKLVEKILESSRGKISKGKNKSEFSLTNIIKEIIEDLELRLKNKDLYIKEELEEIMIYGVLEDFEQIILNLLDNSIKYSDSNEISIKLYKENENIVLKLKNNCLEIPIDIKDRLFEPFKKYNYYDDISKEVSSSGLGLYLCSELAKENEWSLNYEFIDNDIIFTLILNI